MANKNKKTMSPQDVLAQFANITKANEYQNTIDVVRFNKAGKVKFQLLAKNLEQLYKARTQHFIPTLPGAGEKDSIYVIDCLGDNCPVCEKISTFVKSGITLEDINETYKPKYPYRGVKNLFVQPEHYLMCAKIILDEADEGTYVNKKQAEKGNVQVIQLTRTTLNNLLTAYEDYISELTSEGDVDVNTVAPLFGILEGAEATDEIQSLSINLRVTVQGAWAYSFTFGYQPTKILASEVPEEKLNVITSPTIEATEDYLQKALKRIDEIKNYFLFEEDTEKLNTNTDIDNLVPPPVAETDINEEIKENFNISEFFSEMNEEK